LPFFFCDIVVDRNERAGESPLPDDAAEQVRQHEGVKKGVPLPTRPEPLGADDVTDQTEDATDQCHQGHQRGGFDEMSPAAGVLEGNLVDRRLSLCYLNATFFT